MLWSYETKVLTVLNATLIVSEDLELGLVCKKRHSPTLCVLLKDQDFSLQTPDGRSVLMIIDNDTALDLSS